MKHAGNKQTKPIWLSRQLEEAVVSGDISELLQQPDITTYTRDKYREVKHLIIQVSQF